MSNRSYYLTIAALLVLLVWVVMGFPSCERNDTPDNLEPARKEIVAAKLKSDSIRTIIDTVTITRTKYITKYRDVRHDSLIPCHEKLQICDTVVIQDSVLIAEQRQLIKQDSIIIARQDTLIKAQDRTIAVLTKSVKKEKRLKRICAAVCCLIAGIAVTK
jgi:hypothetical protein